MALKILLADDSMTAQNMGKKILLDAGYEVVAVSNGAAAIKRIASDRPDIIIVDEYMPGYTGSEVCERVKNSPDTAKTPVLLTVGKMEPFSPDKANKVRADGVLIKPFEATDLIAVIQSIADKISGVAGATKASTTAAHDSASRAVEPPLNEYEDAERAESEPLYPETVRLTPEQVLAVQNKTYTDWVSSEEAESGEKFAAEVSPEMPVTSAALGAEQASAPASGIPSILEPLVSSVDETESRPAVPIMPGLDASEAPIARAMAGQIGRDFFTIAPASAADTDFTPGEAPAMFGSALEPAPEPSQHVFSVQSAVPEPFEAAPEGSLTAHAASLELETSSPLTPGPSMVAPLNGFEATIASPEEVAAEVAPELEINSPIHLQPDVTVSADPSLVTNEEDLSQFVTKFGRENGEESHVGIAAELPPEQLAALTSPAVEHEIKQEVPQLEAPEMVYPPVVDYEPSSPVLQEAVVLTPEPEPALEEKPNRVLEEVGTITTSALNGTGPMVAYVPSLEDTQPIPPFVAPQTEETQPIPAYETKLEVAATEAAVAPEAEPVSAVETEAVSALETPAVTAPGFETAAAVAAGVAFSTATHFFTVTETAPAQAEAPAEALVGQIDEAVHEAQRQPEPVLAPPSPVTPEPVTEASFVHSEVEEQAAEAADEFIASAAPEVEMAVESEAGHDAHMIADSKVSEAVSRAFEKLRPQLISEIMKELSK